jgi:hypothetical protein
MSQKGFRATQRLVALCFVMSRLDAAEIEQTFTKITNSQIVAVSGYGTAWGDYDQDGFPDLFIGTTFGNPTGYSPNELYHNRRDGTFELVAAAAFPADIGGISAGWADYDNDGFLDLFVSKTGADALYHNNSDGTFSKTQNAATMESAPGFASPWADFDNDGLVDLFVANESAPNVLLQNTGNGSFLKITNWTPSGTLFSQWAAWGDYDNDGLPDLVVANYLGNKNVLYHNEGSGRFTSVTNSPVLSIPGESSVCIWGDYDNDGYLDLFMGAARTTTNALFHNNRDGTFSLVANSVVTTDVAGSHGAAWGDYDNDGHLDLLVSGGSLPCRLYHNNRDGVFTRVTNGSLPNEGAQQRSCAWIDYNRDGFLDAWVARTAGYSNGLYKNNGNSNAWLVVQAEGRLSNRAAIGAKVRIQATIGGQSFWQMRQITSSELTASIGLGDATNAEVVRVEWPSGIVQELRNVLPRQWLTVVEPEARITPAVADVEPGTNVTFTCDTSVPPPLALQWRRNGIPLPGETNSTLVITNVLAEHGGQYTVTIRAPEFSFDTPAAWLLGPVLIAQQPQAQFLRLGSNAVFTISATGRAPLTFQWLFNGTNIPEATTSNLLLTNIQSSNTGTYAVAISNSFGLTLSSNVPLALLIRPAIVQYPLSQTVVAGGSVTLSASATGSPLPLTFLWRRNNAALTNISVYSTNCFVTITNIQATPTTNAFQFRVAVTNLAGSSVLSSTAAITVLADVDGDGLPDDWENAHGLNAGDRADASLDGDGDGFSNLQEYLAGTDAADKNSFLRIESMTCGGGTTALHFFAASNCTYTVQACNSLPTLAWSRVADITAAETNRFLELFDSTESGMRQRFYRITCPRWP